VGGGYPEADGGLWREPFGWVLGEATAAGLLVDQRRLDHVLRRTAPPSAPWTDRQHESLTGLWWLAEVFPKLRWRPGVGRRPALGLGRRRFVQDGAILHRSALRRIRETSYVPSNLSPAFIKRVRGLTDVPDGLAYVSNGPRQGTATPAPAAERSN
jgi:hypothetical protein